MILKKQVEKYLPQLARAYRMLRDQRLNSRRSMVKTEFGFDMIGGEGLAGSRSAGGELKLFQELLLKTDVFVDVGANCGIFTLMACNAGIQTIAFEPNLENCNFLLFNLHHNGFKNVEVFPIALSKAPGVLPLFGGGEGASLEANWGGMASTYSRMVAVNTLNNLVSPRFSHERLLVKIDVEGHEFDVLTGAGDLLARCPAPVWLLEHGFTENFSGKINPHFQDLFDLFWRHGYVCCTADKERRKVIREDVRRWLAQGTRDFGFLNYLFYKDSLPK